MHAVLVGMCISAELLAIIASHYWPERERWPIEARYAYGSAAVAVPWSLAVWAIEPSAMIAVALYWFMLAAGGAITVAVYRLADPWLARRRVNRARAAKREAANAILRE